MKLKLLILLLLGIWLGMLLGVSFLEAPLKFRAPNITLKLGLGIGKIVFSALNKIEIIFSISLLLWLSYQYKHVDNWSLFALSILILFVAIQSLLLLPILNTRVDTLLAGGEVEKTLHHFYYIGIELGKVVLLIYGFAKIYSHD